MSGFQRGLGYLKKGSKLLDKIGVQSKSVKKILEKAQTLNQVFNTLKQFHSGMQQALNFENGNIAVYPEMTIDELVNVVRDNPQVLQKIFEEEAQMYENYIGPQEDVMMRHQLNTDPTRNVVVASGADSIENLAYEWNPPKNTILENDYNQIKKYFSRSRKFSNLTEGQQSLVESLRWKDTQFSGEENLYGSEAVGLKYHELRDQLTYRLDRDLVLNRATAKNFQDVTQSFAEAAEHWSYDFVQSEMKNALDSARGVDVDIDPDTSAGQKTMKDMSLGEKFKMDESVREIFWENPDLNSNQLILLLQNADTTDYMAWKNAQNYDVEVRFQKERNLFDMERELQGIQIDKNYETWERFKGELIDNESMLMKSFGDDIADKTFQEFMADRGIAQTDVDDVFARWDGFRELDKGGPLMEASMKRTFFKNPKMPDEQLLANLRKTIIGDFDEAHAIEVFGNLRGLPDNELTILDWVLNHPLQTDKQMLRAVKKANPTLDIDQEQAFMIFDRERQFQALPTEADMAKARWIGPTKESTLVDNKLIDLFSDNYKLTNAQLLEGMKAQFPDIKVDDAYARQVFNTSRENLRLALQTDAPWAVKNLAPREWEPEVIDPETKIGAKDVALGEEWGAALKADMTKTTVDSNYVDIWGGGSKQPLGAVDIARDYIAMRPQSADVVTEWALNKAGDNLSDEELIAKLKMESGMEFNEQDAFSIFTELHHGLKAQNIEQGIPEPKVKGLGYDKVGAERYSEAFNVNDDVVPALNEMLQDPAFGESAVLDMISMTSSGEMFLKVPAFKKWYTHQMDNLKYAPWTLLAMQGINELPHGSEINQWVNIGMAAFDLLMSGDPTAVIMNGIMALVGEFGRDQQRAIDNIDPEKVKGSKLGYVRGADNKFHAAYLASRIKSSGFLQGESTIKMMYGDNLVFQKIDGVMKPFFIDGVEDGKTKMMEFTVQDSDLDGFNSSREYVETKDTLRNWYFLSDEDYQNVFSPVEGSDNLTYEEFKKPYENDTSSWSYEQRQRDDWRKVLDIMDKRQHPDDAAQDKWTAVDKGLRYVMQSSLDAYQPYAYTRGKGGMEQHNPLVLAGQYLSTLTPGQDGTYAAYMRDNDALGWDNYPENEYVKDGVLKQLIVDLVRLQDIAAHEQAGEERYSGTRTGWDNSQSELGAKYLDLEKDIPVATNADMLQLQLDHIANYEDRSVAQRDYLNAKATTRYWIGQVAARGGSDAMVEDFVRTWSGIGRDIGERHWTGKIQNYFITTAVNPDFKNRGIETMFPWANKNDGVLPEEFNSFTEFNKTAQTWMDSYKESDNYKDIHTPKWQAKFSETTGDDKDDKTQKEPENELPPFDKFGNPRWVYYLDQKLQNINYVLPEKTDDTKPDETKPPETKPDETKPDETKIVEGWSYTGGEDWGESGDTRETLQYGFEYTSSDPYNTEVMWQGQIITMNEYYGILDKIAAAPPDEQEPWPEEPFVYPTVDSPTTISKEYEGPRYPHSIIDKIVPPPKISPLEEFIQEQHPEDLLRGTITSADVPWLAFTSVGQPALTNDDLLHSQLGLGESVKVVQSQQGVRHTAFDPTMVTPRFHSTLEATPVSTQPITVP